MLQELVASWSDFKTLITSKRLIDHIQYVENSQRYRIFFIEAGAIIWEVYVEKGSADATDFETNHKSTSNSGIVHRDDTGKQIMHVYSGDSETETVAFASMVDDLATSTPYGATDDLRFDASLTVNTGGRSFDTTTSKAFYVPFVEDIRIVGGSLFWENGGLDCWGDCYVICPVGGVLGLDQYGNPIIAEEETPLSHYVVRFPMLGNCNSGAQIRGEAATNPLHMCLGWQIKIVITKPAANTTFQGAVMLDVYRKTTV